MISRHGGRWPKTVAELITSLVKTTTLASKSDCQRMQYWQAIGAEYLIQIDKRPRGRIL